MTNKNIYYLKEESGEVIGEFSLKRDGSEPTFEWIYRPNREDGTSPEWIYRPNKTIELNPPMSPAEQKKFQEGVKRLLRDSMEDSWKDLFGEVNNDSIAADDCIKDLRNSNYELEVENSALKSENKELKETIECLNEIGKEADENESEILKAYITILEGKLEEEQSLSKTLSEELLERNIENELFQNLVDTLEEESNSLVIDAEEEIDRLEGKVLELKASVEFLEVELVASDKKVIELKEANKRLQETVERKGREWNGLLNDYYSMENDLIEYRQEWNEEIRNMEAANSKLQTSLNAAVDEISNLNMANKHVIEELERERDKNDRFLIVLEKLSGK